MRLVVILLTDAHAVGLVATGVVSLVGVALARAAHRIAPPAGRTRLIQRHFTMFTWSRRIATNSIYIDLDSGRTMI